ncbi:transglycosylase domain-containing protein [Thermodesulfobium sp.]
MLNKVKRFAIFIGIFLTLFIVGLLAGVTIYSFIKVPNVESLENYAPPEATQIFDRNGKLITTLYDSENRIVVPLKDIPKSLQDAVIAIEDSRFYSEIGFDPIGIIRAFITDVVHGREVEGGSTLTQQLVKNIYLTPQQTIMRKLVELVLAIRVDLTLSKPKILELYLNEIYLGHGTNGVEAASKYYFNKDVKDLNLAESAMLAGLISAPEYYSPVRNFELAKERQKIVLNRMVDVGFITKAQAEEAYKQPIKIAHSNSKWGGIAPYFVDHVLQEMAKKYGYNEVYTGGLKIYTTLDYKMQEEADNLVKEYVNKYKYLHVSEGALVAIDPQNGEIRAYVGGVSYEKSQFDRVIMAERQPGSAFKPFVYLTALEEGMTPDTMLSDTPVTYPTPEGPWSPQNYDRTFMGNIPMWEALMLSRNVPSVKLLAKVGVENAIKTARKAGIKSPLSPNLALVLGASDVNLLELTSAYGVFANRGIRVEPIFVTKVLDRNGKVLEENKPIPQRVFDEKYIAVLDNMLANVILHGTGMAANIGRPAAGKTGTTDDFRNAWFIGFTPNLVCGVWVGNDDNSPMYGVVGGSIPAEIWASFMKSALAGTPVAYFPKSSEPIGSPGNSEVSVWVCGDSDKLATDKCPNPILKSFPKDKVPTEYDNRYPGGPYVPKEKKPKENPTEGTQGSTEKNKPVNLPKHENNAIIVLPQR